MGFFVSLSPARDRLMVSSTFLARTDRRAALDSAAEMTRRFPDSWMAWLALGDGLVHLGPPLGHGMEEAQDALARSLALNPDLVPAWEHYAWAASVRRDADGLGRAVDALTDRGGLEPEDLRDLAGRQPLEIAQHERVAIQIRQACDPGARLLCELLTIEQLLDPRGHLELGWRAHVLSFGVELREERVQRLGRAA